MVYWRDLQCQLAVLQPSDNDYDDNDNDDDDNNVEEDNVMIMMVV